MKVMKKLLALCVLCVVLLCSVPLIGCSLFMSEEELYMRDVLAVVEDMRAHTESPEFLFLKETKDIPDFESDYLTVYQGGEGIFGNSAILTAHKKYYEWYGVDPEKTYDENPFSDIIKNGHQLVSCRVSRWPDLSSEDAYITSQTVYGKGMSVYGVSVGCYEEYAEELLEDHGFLFEEGRRDFTFTVTEEGNEEYPAETWTYTVTAHSREAALQKMHEICEENAHSPYTIEFANSNIWKQYSKNGVYFILDLDEYGCVTAIGFAVNVTNKIPIVY